MLIHASCQTSNERAGDLRHHDVHLTAIGDNIDGTSMKVSAAVLKIVNPRTKSPSNWLFVKTTIHNCVLIDMFNPYNATSPEQHSIFNPAMDM